MEGKIRSRKELSDLVGRLKEKGKKIALTNGCFDILHVGHLQTFREGKKAADILIVALNSDRSVRALKGRDRPLVPEEQRATMLAALQEVDYVVIFEELDPLAIITEIKPDILLKGEDWAEGKVIGQRVVEEGGGSVIRVPLVKGVSTSQLIERIRASGK